MAKRNGYRIGDWLVQDDLTGETVYASETVKDYRGNIVHRKNFLRRNPQDFIRAIKESVVTSPVRAHNVISPEVYYSDTVGDTNVPTPVGPATHLYDAGIGEMIIETNFTVR